MNPAELAQFNSLTDFPVPSRITNLLKRDESKGETKKKRRHSDASKATEKGEGIFSQKLLVSQKEGELDEAELKLRQQLVSTTSPGELGAIRGFSDITSLFKNRSRSSSATREKKRK